MSTTCFLHHGPLKPPGRSDRSPGDAWSRREQALAYGKTLDSNNRHVLDLSHIKERSWKDFQVRNFEEFDRYGANISARKSPIPRAPQGQAWNFPRFWYIPCVAGVAQLNLNLVRPLPST